LIVTLDGVTYMHAGTEDKVSFDDSRSLLALFTNVTGETPSRPKSRIYLAIPSI